MTWTKDEILFGKNGGHGMIFKGVDGKLRITFHQPNSSPDERMRIFDLDDDGEWLSVKGLETLSASQGRLCGGR